MSTTTIREACSCGATIDVVGGRYRSTGHPANPRGAEEIVERWRVEHRHDLRPDPPAPEPMPRETQLDALVDRADPRGADVPIFGFQRNPAEDDGDD